MRATNETADATIAIGDRDRAVVVDDSHFMRTVISDILEDGGIDVVAEAADGREAIDAVHEHRPDVVTMDVEMDGMDGLEAVERIMAERPTPILMLSAHTDDRADVTFDALDRGAVDFFTKPGGEVSAGMPALETQLLETVRTVARADVSSPTSRLRSGVSASPVPERSSYLDRATLVIGSSTGGPAVVEEILSTLPLDADLRVLVVQHMPPSFTGRFAARIDEASDYLVREASDGDRVGGGEAVIAKGGFHMEVARYSRGRIRVRLTEDPPVHSVRPAIDVTMETAAATVDDPLTGAVLTGMGQDGAAGIEAIKAAGGATLAQDEATSTVFGMPKRAIETGAVDDVHPRDRLVQGILRSVTEDQR